MTWDRCRSRSQASPATAGPQFGNAPSVANESYRHRSTQIKHSYCDERSPTGGESRFLLHLNLGGFLRKFRVGTRPTPQQSRHGFRCRSLIGAPSSRRSLPVYAWQRSVQNGAAQLGSRSLKPKGARWQQRRQPIGTLTSRQCLKHFFAHSRLAMRFRVVVGRAICSNLRQPRRRAIWGRA
jgi:hypothetical protein